ncbi:reverse transcriptase domain-containing protein [Tanacetum coccineum]
METKRENLKLDNTWKLYTDGASSFDGSGTGLMLISPGGKEYTYALHFKFETTNNEAEYEALLAGLRIAQEMEIRCLAIFTDSQLMVSQIKGLFEARQLTIKQYVEKVKEILKGFDIYTIEHVRCSAVDAVVTSLDLLADAYTRLMRSAYRIVLTRAQKTRFDIGVGLEEKIARREQSQSLCFRPAGREVAEKDASTPEGFVNRLGHVYGSITPKNWRYGYKVKDYPPKHWKTFTRMRRWTLEGGSKNWDRLIKLEMSAFGPANNFIRITTRKDQSSIKRESKGRDRTI